MNTITANSKSLNLSFVDSFVDGTEEYIKYDDNTYTHILNMRYI